MALYRTGISTTAADLHDIIYRIISRSLSDAAVWDSWPDVSAAAAAALQEKQKTPSERRTLIIQHSF